MLNAIARSTTKLLRRSYTNQMKIRNKTTAIATASNYNREYHWKHLNYIAKSLYSTENSTENVDSASSDNAEESEDKEDQAEPETKQPVSLFGE